jgi:hypothetical protein
VTLNGRVNALGRQEINGRVPRLSQPCEASMS